eukprot:1144702-Pelagomonas_calceolata.AAC.5
MSMQGCKVISVQQGVCKAARAFVCKMSARGHVCDYVVMSAKCGPHGLRRHRSRPTILTTCQQPKANAGNPVSWPFL